MVQTASFKKINIFFVPYLTRAGVRLIDTAYMYHNEEEVGKAVRESGIPREEIFVTTKLYPNQFADAENAIDEAVEKLNIGYIDLMLLHHPGTDDVKAYKAMEKGKSVPSAMAVSDGIYVMIYEANGFAF